MDDKKTPKPTPKNIPFRTGSFRGTGSMRDSDIATTSFEASRHARSVQASKNQVPTAEEAKAQAERERACDALGLQMQMALEKIRNDKSWDRNAPKGWMQEQAVEDEERERQEQAVSPRKQRTTGADTPECPAEKADPEAKPPTTDAHSVNAAPRMVISWFGWGIVLMESIPDEAFTRWFALLDLLCEARGWAIERLGSAIDLIFGCRMRSITRQEFFAFQREWDSLNNEFDFRFSGMLLLMSDSGEHGGDLPFERYIAGAKQDGDSIGRPLRHQRRTKPRGAPSTGGPG